MNKNDKDLNFVKKNLRYFILVALLLIFILKFWNGFTKSLASVILAFYPLIIGLAIAYVLNILMSSFEKKYVKIFDQRKRLLNYKRPLCLSLAFLSLIIIVSMIMILVVPQLISCIELITKNSTTTVKYISSFISKVPVLRSRADYIDRNFLSNFDPEDFMTRVAKFLYNGLGGNIGNIYTTIKSVISKFTMVFIGIIISIYILGSKEKLKSQIKRLMNAYVPKHSKRITHILSVFNDSFHNFIIGQVKDAMILGIMVTLGMFILRLPYPIMIGVIVAVTALVPIFGALAGAVIGAILILPVSSVKALIFIIFFIVVQQIDNHIMYPKVVGNSIGLPGLFVLVSITVGGSLFGMLGMICAVPIFSAIYRLLKEDIRKREQSEKTA